MTHTREGPVRNFPAAGSISQSASLWKRSLPDNFEGGCFRMNKTELITAVAQEAEITKKDAEKTVKAVLDVITAALDKGEKVQIIGFGTFEVRERKEREGINPTSQEKITIPASRTAAFKVSKQLKERLNK